MINTTIEFLINNEWVDVTRDMQYPVEETTTLDGALDCGFLKSIPTERKEIYPRFMKVRISSYTKDENENRLGEDDVRYYLANGKVSLKRTMEPVLYIHDFILIEPTKLLERIIINGMSVSKNMSVLNVVRTLLETNPLRRVGQEQPYKLDLRIVTKLNSFKSCEFKWSHKMTLRECLQEIGGFIGAEPRLIPNLEDDRKFDTLTFDFFGETTGRDISDVKYAAYEEDYFEEQCCSSIETYAENLIAQADDVQSSVTYPSKNGWITPRTTDTKISDKNCEIILQEPIYKICKVLVCGVTVGYKCTDELGNEGSGGHTFTESMYADISKYVFEEQMWQLLPEGLDTTTATEFAKSKALKYRQNDNIITNLSYEERVGGDLVYVKQAIDRILIKVFEDNVDKYISKGSKYTPFSATITTFDIRDFKFRVEYIPLAPSKLRAVNDLNPEGLNTLCFNQQAEYNDSTAIGRNMKHTANRLNGKTKTVAFVHNSVEEAPRIGDTYDGCIVTKVTRTEKTPYRLSSVFEATENGGRIQERLGIDKKYRQYKIPTEGVEKHLYYQDFCVISDEKKKNTSSANLSFIESFKDVFEPGASNHLTEVDCATIQGTNANKVLLQVQSSAVANSLKFSFRAKDNYSAGVRRDGNEIIDVPYSDGNGEFEIADIMLGSELVAGYDANALPLCPTGINSKISGAFIVKKDAGERIAMTYQMHIVSDNGVIVGSKLTENNPLVRENSDSSKVFKIWTLNKPASKYSVLVDPSAEHNSNATLEANIDEAEGANIVLTMSGLALGKGWAVTDGDGYLYLAENKPCGSNTRVIHLNFRG